MENLPYTITEREYNAMHNDYRGVWDTDNMHGTNYNGRRTLLTWIKGQGTTLIIEGASLKIVKTDKENINPLR